MEEQHDAWKGGITLGLQAVWDQDRLQAPGQSDLVMAAVVS